MNKHSLVRLIYLYLFSLVGLVLIIIGSVRFIDMGLKTFVFKQADKENRLYRIKPPAPATLERIKQAEKLKDCDELSQEDRELFGRWLEDYDNWKKEEEKLDPVLAERHRQASGNLAMILVGLPLFYYHWRIIRKEDK